MVNTLARPSFTFAVLSLFYWGTFCLGPYKYSADGTALVFMVFCGLLFYVCMVVGERANITIVSSQSQAEIYQSIKTATNLFTILSIACVVFGLIYIALIANVFFVDNIGSVSEMRRHLTAKQVSDLTYYDHFLRKIAEFFTFAAPATVLWFGLAVAPNTTKEKTLNTLNVILPSVAVLLQGARNPAIFIVFVTIFVIVVRIWQQRDPLNFLLVGKKTFLMLVLAVVFFVLAIFLWRLEGVSSDSMFYNVESVNLPNVSQAEMREVYEPLLTENPVGEISAQLAYYFSHSASIFSYYWDAYSVEPETYGFYGYRVPVLVLETLGVTGVSYEKVLSVMSFRGAYPSAIHGFVLDFGLMLAPAIIATFGFLLGYTYMKAKKGSSWAYAGLPLCHCLSLSFWVYPINWGNIDYVVTVMFMIWLSSKFVGGLRFFFHRL